MSLLGFAVTINSAILILAGAAFFYSPDPAVRASGKEADLFGAHALVKQYVGTAASFLFALALLCVRHSTLKKADARLAKALPSRVPLRARSFLKASSNGRLR